jgi:hypothetical protein
MAMCPWYATIKPIADAAPPQFLPYTTNGQSVGVQGSNPTIITASNLNYGQNTHQHLAKNEQGLCLGSQQGNDWWLVYFNPYRSPLDTERIVATINGTTVDVGDLEGKQVHVFTS